MIRENTWVLLLKRTIASSTPVEGLAYWSGMGQGGSTAKSYLQAALVYVTVTQVTMVVSGFSVAPW